MADLGYRVIEQMTQFNVYFFKINMHFIDILSTYY